MIAHAGTAAATTAAAAAAAAAAAITTTAVVAAATTAAAAAAAAAADTSSIAADTTTTTTATTVTGGNDRATCTTFHSFPYPLSHRRKSIIIQLINSATTNTNAAAAAAAAAVTTTTANAAATATATATATNTNTTAAATATSNANRTGGGGGGGFDGIHQHLFQSPMSPLSLVGNAMTARYGRDQHNFRRGKVVFSQQINDVIENRYHFLILQPVSLQIISQIRAKIKNCQAGIQALVGE